MVSKTQCATRAKEITKGAIVADMRTEDRVRKTVAKLATASVHQGMTGFRKSETSVGHGAMVKLANICNFRFAFPEDPVMLLASIIL